MVFRKEMTIGQYGTILLQNHEVTPQASPTYKSQLLLRYMMGEGERGEGRAEPLVFVVFWVGCLFVGWLFFFSIKPCMNKQLMGDYFVEGKMTMVSRDIIRSVDKTLLVANE